MFFECPCGSQIKYSKCCELYLKGENEPPTAEALMRSRYTAYVKHNIEYLTKTLYPSQRHDFNAEQAREWAVKSKWIGLQIVSTHEGGPEDSQGEVEFIARFESEGQKHEHHERGFFRKKEGHWFFYEGRIMCKPPVVREAPKIGRNDPCPCGTKNQDGRPKKYKNCHGR